MSTRTVTMELTCEQAAALKRFAEKVSFSHARSVLYPHVPADIRSEQAHQVVSAFGVLDEALAESGARAWPWIETGSTR
jgi:hypothetical protein